MGRPFSAEISLGGLEDFPGQIDGDLVVECKRPDRHTGHAADILDQSRGQALHQHQMALTQIGADHARGIEPRESLTTIGVLRIVRT